MCFDEITVTVLLHTGGHVFLNKHVMFITVKVKVTLRLVVYRQSVRLGAKLLEDNDQRFIFPTESLWS
jgi:hypothetical protein